MEARGSRESAWWKAIWFSGRLDIHFLFDGRFASTGGWISAILSVLYTYILIRIARLFNENNSGELGLRDR
jgi:hypothetical protein